MTQIYEKLKKLAEAGKMKQVKWFALNCAKSVAHRSEDKRAAESLAVVEEYLNGNATYEQLLAIKSTAIDVVDDAITAFDCAVGAATYCAVVTNISASALDVVNDAADASAAAAISHDALKKQHIELDTLLAEIKE